MKKLFYLPLLLAITSSVFAMPLFHDHDPYCENIRERALVSNVDFPKYIGKWYELYHSQGFYFDHGCRCTQATYSLNKDGSVKVDNECVRDGQLVTKIGHANIIGNASLSVQFGILPFRAPYDIIYISDDYEYAAVMSCSYVPVLGGLNIWILGRHRDGSLDVERMDDVFRRLRDVQISTNELVQTNQTQCSDNEEDESFFNHFHETNITYFDLNRWVGTWNIVAEIPDIVEHVFTHECHCMRTSISANLTTEQLCFIPQNRTEHLVRAQGRIEEISVESSIQGRFMHDIHHVHEHYQILDVTDDYNYALLLNEFADSFCVYFLSRNDNIPNYIFQRFIRIATSEGVFNSSHLRILSTDC